MGAQPSRKKTDTSVTLVNGGTNPMVYDDAGHVLAAGGRVTVDALDGTGRDAVERGYLVSEGKSAASDPEPESTKTDKTETSPGASDQD